MGERSPGTADEAATARESGYLSMSAQIRSKYCRKKGKRTPVTRSVALMTSTGASGRWRSAKVAPSKTCSL